MDEVCESSPGDTLHVWAPTHGRIDAAFDGRPAAATPLDVEGGTRVDLTVPGSAAKLDVSIEGRIVRSFRLARPIPVPGELSHALSLVSEGREAEASAELVQLALAEDAFVRARAQGTLARLALRRGEAAEIDARFHASIEACRGAGRSSEAVNDAAAWAFSLLDRSRLSEARRVVDDFERDSGAYTEGRARGIHYEGKIALATGRTRVAIERFRLAIRLARRAGADALLRAARQDLAALLSDLGRPREALDDLVALREEYRGRMTKCAEANLVQNIGWYALLVPGSPHGDAKGWLEESLRLHRESCHSEREIVNALGALVVAELDRGDIPAARRRLEEARAAVKHPPVINECEWLLCEGRIALAEHAPGRALAAFDKLRARAIEAEMPDWQRIGDERRAEALVASGDTTGALRALEEASRVLSSATREVPLGEGRSGYLRERESVDERAIELFVATGHPKEALLHLRRARARELSSLLRASEVASLSPERRGRFEQAVAEYLRTREALDKEAASDWSLSAATLAAREAERRVLAERARREIESALADLSTDVATDEMAALPDAPSVVTLALSPAAGGYIGLVAERGRVRAVRLAAAPPLSAENDPPQVSLSPLREELLRAKRVAVIAFGEAARIDVHALPLDGVPLGARVPVVYPMDRGAPRARRGPGESGALSLVVGDATRDLESARVETRGVEAALRLRGDGVTVLVGGAASGAAVRSELARAGLFHYAGHGRVSGLDGWESSLPLAEHASLAVADILALAKVPARVVLMGCDTARASGASSGDGLSIAQAFVIEGADEVVGATRVVDDAAAARMTAALYRALAVGVELPEALRAAASELSLAGDADWSAYRVLVP